MSNHGEEMKYPRLTLVNVSNICCMSNHGEEMKYPRLTLVNVSNICCMSNHGEEMKYPRLTLVNVSNMVALMVQLYATIVCRLEGTDNSTPRHRQPVFERERNRALVSTQRALPAYCTALLYTHGCGAQLARGAADAACIDAACTRRAPCIMSRGSWGVVTLQCM